jgi:hypothetical protein
MTIQREGAGYEMDIAAQTIRHELGGLDRFAIEVKFRMRDPMLLAMR